MNIKTLVNMAKEKNPNKFLAKFSIKWTKTINPVISALAKESIDKIIVICLGVGLIASIFCFSYGIPTTVKIIASAVSIIAGFAASIFFGLFYLYDDIGRGSDYADLSKFIRAVSLLEKIIGKPLNEWGPEVKPETMAGQYLAAEASKLKAAEEEEKRDRESRPWAPSREKSAAPQRKVFETGFELLTRLLEMPSGKEIYFEKFDSSKSEN